MRGHRRSYLSGLFFTSGNYDERSPAEDFAFSRQYTDTVSEGMINDERIEMAHRQEEEQKREEHPTKVADNLKNIPGKDQPDCL